MGKIPYKFTKVDTIFGGEIEDDFALIKGAFRIYQFHGHVTILDTLMAHAVGLCLFMHQMFEGCLV
jgi:hypothetical protein